MMRFRRHRILVFTINTQHQKAIAQIIRDVNDGQLVSCTTAVDTIEGGDDGKVDSES